MTVKTTAYRFHHIGIPTAEPRKGERYSSTFKMYTSGGENSEFRVQYHRFEEGCPLHPLIQTMTHVAFVVDDLQQAIQGKAVFMQPYEPFAGFKVAMVMDSGMPIELIETTLSEEEIWGGEHKNSVIYPGE
ncbi:VOC family protein [Legionella dresdenensis]|uniref:VOC family protein n=1 Tax=Legionella dresdenensis TaxID=450200 RepID=A0ABV8CDY2_9GAMM